MTAITLTGGGGALRFLCDLIVEVVDMADVEARDPFDMTDCGLITEISSLTDNSEAVELVRVELTGATPGGLGAELFFFLRVGAGGGVDISFFKCLALPLTISFFRCLAPPFIIGFLGLVPVLGAATGSDILTRVQVHVSRVSQ